MNAKDVLFYGHDFVMRYLKDLPDDQWDTPNVCGWWSTKNIIGHLASYECLLVEVLRSFQGGGPAPYLDQLASLGPEGFNDFQVDIRKDKTPREQRQEYEQAAAAALDLVARIPGETLRRPGTLPWYGAEYSLDDFLVYQYYGHKREHTAQINVFIDSLKAAEG
jgi:hypothetical protein